MPIQTRHFLGNASKLSMHHPTGLDAESCCQPPCSQPGSIGVALAAPWANAVPRFCFSFFNEVQMEGPGCVSSGLQTWRVWMPFHVMDESCKPHAGGVCESSLNNPTQLDQNAGTAEAKPWQRSFHQPLSWTGCPRKLHHKVCQPLSP